MNSSEVKAIHAALLESGDVSLAQAIMHLPANGSSAAVVDGTTGVTAAGDTSGTPITAVNTGLESVSASVAARTAMSTAVSDKLQGMNIAGGGSSRTLQDTVHAADLVSNIGPSSTESVGALRELLTLTASDPGGRNRLSASDAACVLAAMSKAKRESSGEDGVSELDAILV